MSVAKVTISIESNLLKKVDRLVKERVFANRSQAVQSAVEEKVSRLDRNRLARECAKLDKAEEQSLADLGWRLRQNNGSNTKRRHRLG